MKANRRRFLRMAGLAGAGAAGLAGGRGSDAAAAQPSGPADAGRGDPEPRVQRFNMSGYAAPRIPTVRVGVIGLGQRGPGHVRTMRRIEGVEIRALCDLLPEKAEKVKRDLAGSGHDPDLYGGSPDAWKQLCERPDLDLVIVTTPWTLHAEMAVYAMEQGKHAASEVPAAGTIEECWRLVETSERTRRHCMMMENYNYMPFQLLMLGMARGGFFGEVVHADCAYNTSKMGNNFSRTKYWDMWWLRQYATRKGNIYPTHGVGPVASIMNINHGDRFDFLVSVDSADFMMDARAAELAASDGFFKEFAGRNYRGTMSVTTIRTKRGRTIMLQHDAATPSPHNMIHGVYGTRGAVLYDPPPPRISRGNHKWAPDDELAKVREEFTPEISRRIGEVAQSSGHGGSDLTIGWHLIDCLRNGLPVPQDVYDAAAWSAILPLSERSVLNESNSAKFPDFTAGAWERNAPNMDIALANGGGDTRVIL